MMNPKFRKTLISGAIAALIAAPAFATSDTTQAGAQAPTEAGQVGQPQSTPGQATERASGQTAGQDSQGAAASLQQVDNQIYSWSADALRGTEVVDQAGDKIGKVESVLLAPDGRSVHAVITMGGLVGIGSREVLVSLDELRPVDDKLQMSATKEQVEALQDYPPEPYTELEGDSPLIGSLVELSAVERGRQMGATPEVTAARTDSAQPGTPRTYDPSATQSAQSATSRSAADGVKSEDASRPAEAPGVAARDRSTTERSAAASAATPMTENPLYGRSADDLSGAKVVDRARNDVGTVQRVVLTPDHRSAFLVIDIGGGFLGLGKRKIVVSLDEVEAVEDGLMMSATKEQIDAHRDYSSEHFVELTGNLPISGAIAEFSALEADKDTSKPKRQ
jgi:sporulation protein YlmC with PRC-barrel domain